MWYYIQAIEKKSHGALAQLGAHDTGSVGVTGSSPVCSIDKMRHRKASHFIYQSKSTGLEAALRKQSGGLFLAVTEVDEPCASGGR